ncbi:MAG: META domain-containing protein [Acidimicrobiia bacterium]|jgi:heat shock protein HslJ
MTGVFLDGEWVVTRYLGADGYVEPETQTQLLIDGDHVSGTMGVNRFTGGLDNDLLCTPLAVTRMAGSPEAMLQEHTLLGHFQEADRIEADESGMRMSREGLITIHFERSGTAPSGRSS